MPTRERRARETAEAEALAALDAALGNTRPQYLPPPDPDVNQDLIAHAREVDREIRCGNLGTANTRRISDAQRLRDEIAARYRDLLRDLTKSDAQVARIVFAAENRTAQQSTTDAQRKYISRLRQSRGLK